MKDNNYGVPYWSGVLYNDDQTPVILGADETVLLKY